MDCSRGLLRVPCMQASADAGAVRPALVPQAYLALEESLDDVGYSVEPPSSEAAFRLVRPKVSFCQPNRSFSQLRGRDEVDSLLPRVIVRKVQHR